MTEYNRKSVKAIFESAGIDIPPKDVLTELCELHQQNTAEKDDRIKELETSLAAAEQERDALKEDNGDGYRKKYEDEKQAFDDFKKAITEKETAAAKEAAAKAYFAKKKIEGKNLDIAMMAAASIIQELELDGDKFKDSAALDKVYDDKLAGLSTKTHEEGAPEITPPTKNQQSAFETMSLADKMKFANEHPNDASVKNWLNKS